jgi:lactoylglutathione lyase
MTLSYVGLRVTDLERSIRFYTEGLGLVEKGRGSMSHGGTFVGLVDPETKVELELNWYPSGSLYAGPYVAGEGLDHLGCEAPDVRAMIDRLVRAGGAVRVEPWVERGRYLIGFVADPDGNWVEVQGPVPPAGGAGTTRALSP